MLIWTARGLEGTARGLRSLDATLDRFVLAFITILKHRRVTALGRGVSWLFWRNEIMRDIMLILSMFWGIILMVVLFGRFWWS